MTYHLGVDLGTTYTAAAVARDGRAEPVTLGTSSVAVPSVVYQSADELVVGQPAVRRAASEPSRVAREFKRRVGDPTPLVLGGTPVPAEMLMARLLDWVVGQVAATEGRPPASLAVTHPANWGEYKLDLLRQASRHVGLQVDHLVPEPVAAATFYASQRELAPGSIVAVYDLGGGTFDAALVRSEETGFRIIGRPDGIERLGGIDFDHAVFRHVADAAGIDIEDADAADHGTAAALTQLRQECVEAKEALSAETDVSIPVMLPNRHTEVRLTRTEFEAMIGAALDETLVALRRAIASAEVAPEQVAAVLLVGGSSRIPLVGQRVMAELNRPVAVDARPKDAIPLGAALAASKAAPATQPATQPMATPTPMAPVPAPTTPMDPVAATYPMPTPGTGTPAPDLQPASSTGGSKKAWWVAAAAALVAILAVAALVTNNNGGGGGEHQAGSTTAPTTDGQGDTTPDTTTSDSTPDTTSGEDSGLPLDLDQFGEMGLLDGMDFGEPSDPLPGDTWNEDTRAAFVADCTETDAADTLAGVGGKTPEDFCNCTYEDVSASGMDVDTFNEGWTTDEPQNSDHPALGVLFSAMNSCALG